MTPTAASKERAVAKKPLASVQRVALGVRLQGLETGVVQEKSFDKGGFPISHGSTGSTGVQCQASWTQSSSEPTGLLSSFPITNPNHNSKPEFAPNLNSGRPSSAQMERSISGLQEMIQLI